MAELSVVVATTVGCLYFFDSGHSEVASKAGLRTVGVLLMIANATWFLLMIRLVVKAGLPGARQFATGMIGKVRNVTTVIWALRFQ